jgi:hypothetical protein
VYELEATPANIPAAMSSVRKKARAGLLLPPQIIKTNYTSVPVPVPDSFLSSLPADAPPVTYTKIDFSTTPLPEYATHYAVILDNVLTPAECTTLIHLAERSAGSPSVPDNGWTPALVNAGASGEFLATDYRNSDRIIWDEKEIVRKIWERCLLAPGLREDLGVIEGNVGILGRKAVEKGHRWRVTRLNERMRFLRYGKGQFFRGMSGPGESHWWFLLQCNAWDALI